MLEASGHNEDEYAQHQDVQEDVYVEDDAVDYETHVKMKQLKEFTVRDVSANQNMLRDSRQELAGNEGMEICENVDHQFES